MITVGERVTAESERCLDPQLWHACAGGMVQMPQVNSMVYYFPQGHAEHAHGGGFSDLATSPRFPPYILCKVAVVKFMADPETDEVFTKLLLVPIPDSNEPQDDKTLIHSANGEKPASFAKTLTQSDANNGGGFSVPRYCAETIFPKLDYTANPPVQTVLAKDVHGEIWKFRHIYRGTPRRHLLTTGWSTFVNQKKLVAGDSIVFLRVDNGDLCLGIRRAKRGVGGWNLPQHAYSGFSSFNEEEDDGRFLRGNVHGNGSNSTRSSGEKIRVTTESVIEAASLAARGQPFEAVYYPRASSPEFCVKAAAVRGAMRVQWSSGMRFKMAFETEDSSRISWFMGTISSVQVADPIRWPTSPWRILQVTWDEPDLLQNVKRVSPWLVELVTNMPAIHLAPFSPPRKKPRTPHPPEFLPLDIHLPAPFFPANSFAPGGNPFCCIQGARQTQFGLSLTDLQLDKLQSSLYQDGFPLLDHTVPSPLRIPMGLTLDTSSPTNGNASRENKKPIFVLFGQPILTEEQLSPGSSGEAVFHEKVVNGNSIGLGIETGHCKVFLESEDMGRSLNLSSLCSYEELYARLADMFSIEKSEMTSHVLYCDSVGAVKHTGDEPFSEFTKNARRLTISLDSGSSESLES